MEKKVGPLGADAHVGQLSPAVWAYVGDAVYELAMRVFTLQEGPKRMHQVHKETARYVTATFQAKASHELERHLTPEELDILRRGRNSKSGHVPKSATPGEYRHSTGLEGLVGYLYLTGQDARLDEIMTILRRLGGEI